MSLPVTSSLIPPNARNLGISFGGICILSRVYSTSCVFGYIAIHARRLGRSLRFTHAQTNSANSTAKGLRLKQAILCYFLIGRNGSPEQIDDVSHANETRDPKNISPLSLLHSDWLGPSVAMYTTRVDSGIHWINHYSVDNAICLRTTYPLDSDLSDG